MLIRKTIPTLTFAAAAALLTCHPAPTRADEPERAVAAIKAKAAPARDWVKEAMLELRVKSKLLAHLKTSDALRVHIVAEGQAITLTGEVEKQSNLALAGALARKVEGVAQVTNSLTLAPDAARAPKAEAAAADAGTEIKDALLETKVKSKLLARTGMHALKINVEAKAGVVSLSGSATDSVHRDEAMRITRATGGVTRVIDQMKIVPSDDAGK